MPISKERIEEIQELKLRVELLEAKNKLYESQFKNISNSLKLINDILSEPISGVNKK